MGYQIFYFMAIFNLYHLLADQTESCEMITRCRTPFTFLACDGCRANMVYWITVANLLSFWHTKQICSIHIWEMTWLVFYSQIYNKSPYVAALAFIWNHAIALHLHSFSLAPTHKGKKKTDFLDAKCSTCVLQPMANFACSCRWDPWEWTETDRLWAIKPKQWAERHEHKRSVEQRVAASDDNF